MIYLVHCTGPTRTGRYMDVAMFENTDTGNASIDGDGEGSTKMPALPNQGQFHRGAPITPAIGSGGRELLPVN